MPSTPASTRPNSIRIAAAALLAASGAAAAVAASAAEAASVRTVSMRDDYFVQSNNKATVTVKRGTTLRVVNRGRGDHNATVALGPSKFRSGRMVPGAVYRKRVTATGRYIIVCTIHPGMQMTLRVTK